MADSSDEAPNKSSNGDEGSPGHLRQAVDLCIMAPLGLLADAGTVVPELVQRGRGQVAQARAVGRFTVGVAGGKVRDVQRSGIEVLRRVASQSFPGDSADADEPVEPADEPAPEPAGPESASAPAGPEDAPASSAEGLAIPDYDSLSASQVVPRLESLSPTELEAVRLYEVGSRGRKTILGRITQLQRPAG